MKSLLSLLMIIYFILLTNSLALNSKSKLRTENKCTDKGKFKADCGAGKHICCNRDSDSCLWSTIGYQCRRAI